MTMTDEASWYPPTGGRVLVTGATGLIGSHLVDMLREATEVHVVSRSAQPAESAGITRWVGDVSIPGTLRKIVERVRPDVVCHLAGLVNGGRSLELLLPTLRTNLVSTVELLEVATRIGCRRVVVAGSLMEEPADRAAGVPGSPYGASRAAASDYSRMCHALFGTPTVVLRPSYAYGPRQHDMSKLVPYVISCFLDDVSPRLTSGDRHIDWVYARDAADAFARALFAPDIEGSTIDIVSGQRHCVRDVVLQLQQITAPQTAEPLFGSVPTRPLEQDVAVDESQALSLLGWRAGTALADGLRETVDCHRELHRKLLR